MLVAWYLEYKEPAQQTPESQEQLVETLLASMPALPDHMRLKPQWEIPTNLLTTK